jgi:dTDP-3-amino-3,4,6-trideoxy-alpha-D-glucose transaminase
VIAERCLPMFDLRPVMERAAPATARHLVAMHASGQYVLGEQVRRFETELAPAFHAGHAVGVGSGSAAIELCLREAGIVRSDQEVIVPSFTSLFTAQAVLAAGARLRIADVDPDTLLLTPENVKEAWTEKTAAVICVHLYGDVCRLDEIAALCRERGVTLIQDACQAHGATFLGKPLTAFSSYTAYSFYPTKNLGCMGDGGAVVTDSARVARRIRLLRDGGRGGGQLALAPAINSRLDEIQACYLRAFLPHLAHWNGHRRRVAKAYRRAGIKLTGASANSVHHLCVMRSNRRESLRSALAAEGIQTAVHYPYPLHRQPAFRSRMSIAETPVTSELASREVISLPGGPHIRELDAEYIAERIRMRIR